MHTPIAVTATDTLNDAPGSSSLLLLDMVSGLSRAMDLISPAVVDHHARVAYVAAALSRQLGYTPQEQADHLLAGLLHDVGAFTLGSRLDALQFETESLAHAEYGYRLLRTCSRFERAAALVRHHHTPYAQLPELAVPWLPEANLLCLADRVDALIDRARPLASQVERIGEHLRRAPVGTFKPDYLDAFFELARQDDFWAGAVEPARNLRLLAPACLLDESLGLPEVFAFSTVFAHIIDFRSRFTAMHSCGVAATAVHLARLAGFSDHELKLIRLAGDLHDLGKLAVPAELIEKPAALTEAEFTVMRNHAAVSYEILASIPGLALVASWGALHHERLDGSGYPFGLRESEIDQGARLVAIADVFTAITEDRPYRAGMNRREATDLLRQQAASGRLDGQAITLLLDHYAEFSELRRESQDEARRSMASFYRDDL